MNALKQAALDQCSLKTFLPLTQQQIKICPLEITDKVKRKVRQAKYKPKPKAARYVEDDGHYNRNQDYEKIDLEQDSKVSVQDLFHLSQAKANSCGLKQYANIVSLIGQPGIGKTTLSKVVTEKSLYGGLENVDKIEWCFYISVKNIGFKSSVTFIDFLLKHSLDANTYNSLLCDGLSETDILHLLLQSKSVFICMDGLDEASTEWTADYKQGLNLKNSNHPLHYIYGLLMGDILPNAKKLFTSRQNHYFSISEKYRPLFVAEVMGLSTKSQEELCKQICVNKSAEVWAVIKSNANISYSCYVPAKCIFIVFVIWKSLSEGGDGRFHSLTHVFANGFKYYFKQNYVRGNEKQEENRKYLNKIAKLAWNGFKQTKIVFSEKDLNDAEINPEKLSGILSTFVTEENWKMTILACEKKSNFSHLIWQEYFAACYLVYLASTYEFNDLIPKLETNRWEVVSKFVFGLFNPVASEAAKACFFETNDMELAAKKNLLLKFSHGQMKKAESGYKTLMQISSWLQEVSDAQFYKEVVPVLPKDIKLNGTLLLTDVSSISDVLSKSKNSHNVALFKNSAFFHNSFKVLLESLKPLRIEVSFPYTII